MDEETEIFFKTSSQIKEEANMAKKKEAPIATMTEGQTIHAEKHDEVNHPQHYHPGTYEAINVIEAWDLGFCLGNAVKYIARAGHKGDAAEDLRKAVWYLNREISRMESKVDE